MLTFEKKMTLPSGAEEELTIIVHDLARGNNVITLRSDFDKHPLFHMNLEEAKQFAVIFNEAIAAIEAQ